MKKYMFGLIAIALAIGFSAFTAPKAKDPTQFWVYSSLDNINFDDAGKYTIEILNDSSDADCNPGVEEPCVLVEVSSTNDTPSELQTYLDGFTTDDDILMSSLTKKSAE